MVQIVAHRTPSQTCANKRLQQEQKKRLQVSLVPGSGVNHGFTKGNTMVACNRAFACATA